MRDTNQSTIEELADIQSIFVERTVEDSTPLLQEDRDESIAIEKY